MRQQLLERTEIASDRWRVVRRALPARRAQIAALGVLLIVLLVSGALGRAVHKPLWNDELVALYVADAPTVGALWDTLAAGTDLNPPLYHLAVRSARALISSEEIATRLPAIIGFAVMMLCLFAFLARREGIAPGLAAAVTPALTGASLFSYEGRPYGFVLAGATVALLGWQLSTERRRPWPLLLCATGIAIAVSSHYYSVLLLLPLGAAEAARSAIRRRIDWPIWVALVAGLAPLALFVPLMAVARSFGPTYVAKATPSALLDYWRNLIGPLAVPMTAAVGAWLLWLAFRPSAGRSPKVNPLRMPAAEIVAVAGFLALPVAGWLLARFVTDAFNDRYVISGVIGVALALALVIARVDDRRLRAGLAAIMVAVFAAKELGSAQQLLADPADLMREHAAINAASASTLPIVVSDARVFLELVHYAPPELSDRLVYLTKPDSVVRALGVDTGSRVLAGFRRVRSLDVREYGAYVREHSRFLVYGRANWISGRLLEDGFTLAVERQNANGILLEAARK